MTDPKRLLKTDTLRTGLFLPQWRKNEATGAIVGVGTGIVTIEVGKAMARKWNMECEIIGYPTPPAALQAIKAGACDFAMFGIEPERVAELDFTPPTVQFDYTYLVPAGSTVRVIADADKPGVKIAAVDKHASTNTLAAQIKHAEIVRRPIPEEGFALLRDGDADVFAMPREMLVGYAEQLPGSRILDDRFGVNNVGAGIAQGQPELLAAMTAYLEDAKASGFIQRVIDGANMPFFKVAPRA